MIKQIEIRLQTLLEQEIQEKLLPQLYGHDFADEHSVTVNDCINEINVYDKNEIKILHRFYEIKKGTIYFNLP